MEDRNCREQRFCLEVGGGGKVAQMMYTHVSKCKTIKGEKKKKVIIMIVSTKGHTTRKQRVFCLDLGNCIFHIA
jgi:hypothetical protein